MTAIKSPNTPSATKLSDVALPRLTLSSNTSASYYHPRVRLMSQASPLAEAVTGTLERSLYPQTEANIRLPPSRRRISVYKQWAYLRRQAPAARSTKTPDQCGQKSDGALLSACSNDSSSLIAGSRIPAPLRESG